MIYQHLQTAHFHVQAAQEEVYSPLSGVRWPLWKRLMINRAQELLIRLIVWAEKDGRKAQ